MSVFSNINNLRVGWSDESSNQGTGEIVFNDEI